jgi:hypothetical protein
MMNLDVQKKAEGLSRPNPSIYLEGLSKTTQNFISDKKIAQLGSNI